jgi:hypothetical protein
MFGKKPRKRRSLPSDLKMVPEEAWPGSSFDPSRIEVWASNKFLVQVFEERQGVLRLSVNRIDIDRNGEWRQDISWDELQQIKREIGRGERYAVEVYPCDADVVNVANMRHLWVLPVPLPIGWFGRSAP